MDLLDLLDDLVERRREQLVDFLGGIADDEVDAVAVPDGAARGAAYVARMAAGLETSLSDSNRWAVISRRIEPDPTWAKATRARYRQFCEMGAGNENSAGS